MTGRRRSTLENRVAVLTGAWSGIGRVIALAFGKEGAAAAVNHRRNLEEAEDGVEQVKGAGGRAVAVKADVTEPEDIRALVQHCVQGFGRLDILANNAGVERIEVVLTPPIDLQ